MKNKVEVLIGMNIVQPDGSELRLEPGDSGEEIPLTSIESLLAMNPPAVRIVKNEIEDLSIRVDNHSPVNLSVSFASESDIEEDVVEETEADLIDDESLPEEI